VRRAPLPLATLAICAAAALVLAVPQLQPALVYNRDAVSHGELWRLLSGNLVHFSAGHAVKDVLALLLAGALIETRRYRHFALLCLASGALIGSMLYATQPLVLVYGGLSGVAVAAVAYLCLHGSADGGAFGRACQIALVGLVAKTTIELVFGAQASADFVPVPFVHLVGALTAAALFSIARLEIGVRHRIPGV